ncbi:MAG: hypothetical protein AAF806_10715 [Bacteroidota bacterium]
MSKRLRYKTPTGFLLNTHFLDVQKSHKSQKALLNLLADRLPTHFGIQFDDCGKESKKNVIYLDDILATGKTTFRELTNFLSQESNGKAFYKYFLEDKARLMVCFLGMHTWGRDNVKYQIRKTFSDLLEKKIIFETNYLIENNPLAYNDQLNCAYPIDDQNPMVQDYLDQIEGTRYEQFAYRKPNRPRSEQFFSSPANRNRFERILLEKGIGLLQKVKKLKVKEIRTLGYTVKSHKTFGLGTLFFTWRNIPNNCPLVFWWEASNWYPLFKVKNRGK